MTKELQLQLLDRWTSTTDKEEFVKIGLQLYPEETRKEMEEMFDRTRKGK